MVNLKLNRKLTFRTYKFLSSPEIDCVLTHLDILKDLKNKQYRPVYFLHGEEDYFIDLVSDYIEEKVLNEAEKSFNLTILYGKEVNHLAVLDSARRYPMMSPYQVVILKEAQDMKDLEELIRYVENPMESTLLVICYKHATYNKFNGKFGRMLKDKAVILEAKKLYDNKLPDWIIAYVKSKGLRIQPDVAILIGEYLGTDLSKVTNELDKLSLNLPTDSLVTTQLVEQHIGISKEYNIFELQKALASKDTEKTNRIVFYFVANSKKNPMVMTVSSLATFFTKVYMLHFLKGKNQDEIVKALDLRSAWFLKDYQLAQKNYTLPQVEQAISRLREYDLKSKGVDFNTTSMDEGELLKELTWHLLHPQ